MTAKASLFRHGMTLTSLVIMQCACSCLLAQTPNNSVTITLDPTDAKTTAIASDFVGLSFEMDDDHVNSTTSVFNGTAGPLSTMIKTLGVKSLRIGGNSGETATYPTQTDMDNMNDFCQLVGANLIWLLPSKALTSVTDLDGYASLAVAMASDKSSKGQTFKTMFEIGNEPDNSITGSPAITETQYDTWFADYLSDLIAQIGSTVQLTGPDYSSASAWANDLSSNANYTLGGTYHGNIGYITGHVYPGGNSQSQTSVATAIATLLSSAEPSQWQTFYNNFPHHAINNHLIPRITETNTFYNGGYAGASNSFAASLWALDYLSYYSTQTNLGGVNFHNVGGSGVYNAIIPYGASSSYTLQGVGYGILAYNQLGGGNAVPTSVTNPSGMNITAYSVLHTSGSERMAIINKSYGTSAANADIVIVPGMTHSQADVMFLTAPSNDPTSTSGIELGGQSVQGDGTWTGTWTLHLTAVSGNFSFTLPPAQAAIVFIHS